MRKVLYFNIGLIMLFSGCLENTSGIRFDDRSIYVSCLLKAGEYIDGEYSMKLGKTTDVENAEWEMLRDSTAAVTIKEIEPVERTVKTVILTYDHLQRSYIDADHLLLIKPEHEYQLKINLITGDTITSKTIVPKDIEVSGDSLIAEQAAWTDNPEGEFPDLVLNTADREHPVRIFTQDDEEFNLYTEIWCMEDWENAVYAYPEDDHRVPDDEEEYCGTTQQYPRRVLGYYMYQPEDGVVNYNSYQGSIEFLGKTRLKVYSIDNNFLSYLYQGDGYRHGGINGGIGIFGSCCGNTLYTLIIKAK